MIKFPGFPGKRVISLLTFLRDQSSTFLGKYDVKVKVSQSCPTLGETTDCPAHGILLARILEWAAFPFYGGSSRSRDGSQVSRVAGRLFDS